MCDQGENVKISSRAKPDLFDHTDTKPTVFRLRIVTFLRTLPKD
jgi:hypothetical protein